MSTNFRPARRDLPHGKWTGFLASNGVMRAFVLGGAEIAERGVATFTVPESFDILKQAGLSPAVPR